MVISLPIIPILVAILLAQQNPIPAVPPTPSGTFRNLTQQPVIAPAPANTNTITINMVMGNPNQDLSLPIINTPNYTISYIPSNVPGSPNQLNLVPSSSREMPNISAIVPLWISYYIPPFSTNESVPGPITNASANTNPCVALDDAPLDNLAPALANISHTQTWSNFNNYLISQSQLGNSIYVTTGPISTISTIQSQSSIAPASGKNTSGLFKSVIIIGPGRPSNDGDASKNPLHRVISIFIPSVPSLPISTDFRTYRVSNKTISDMSGSGSSQSYPLTFLKAYASNPTVWNIMNTTVDSQ